MLCGEYSKEWFGSSTLWNCLPYLLPFFLNRYLNCFLYFLSFSDRRRTEQPYQEMYPSSFFRFNYPPDHTWASNHTIGGGSTFHLSGGGEFWGGRVRVVFGKQGGGRVGGKVAKNKQIFKKISIFLFKSSYFTLLKKEQTPFPFLLKMPPQAANVFHDLSQKCIFSGIRGRVAQENSKFCLWGGVCEGVRGGSVLGPKPMGKPPQHPPNAQVCS